jgi:phenylacetate-coenzyme A ligase PaaK-like adenylate-forming protein
MHLAEKLYSSSPVTMQTLLLNLKAIELYHERYGRKFWNLFEEFKKNEWRGLSDLEEWQNRRLRELVRHAYDTVPYYREVFTESRISPEDIRTVDDLHRLPILTKDIIKKNFNRLISSKIPKRKIRHGHTSGTTGSPLNVSYDIQTCVAHHVVDWRWKNWAGLEYGQAYASLQGRVIVPTDCKKPPFWRKNYINNQLFLSSFHLTENNLPHYFEKLSKDNIGYLEGYPSNIYILALYLIKKNITFPMKAILTSSETLFSYQKEAIEKAFSCEIFDSYGMAERVVFATECNHHQGHHLNLDYGITEFLNSDNEPVSQGKLGTIVATSLHNFAMPLIRYQTNDSCTLKKIACSCGRGFPMMDAVATKNEAIVTLPDGRLISPSVLTHPFKPMENIIESQIIQEKIDLLRVKIVKNEKYGMKDEEALIAGFSERLGNDIQIMVEYVEEIPRTKSGKFKWVVSRIEPQF